MIVSPRPHRVLGLIALAALLIGCDIDAKATKSANFKLPTPKAYPDPVTTQLDPGDLVFPLNATVDAKPVKVFFDPSVPDTIAEALPKGPATLSFSNRQSMKIYVSKGLPTGGAGRIYLGYDDLRHSAIGFDVQKHLVCFWPYGVTDGDLWLKDPRETSPAPTDIEVVNLAPAKGGLGVPAQIQGTSNILKLNASLYQTRLQNAPETGLTLIPNAAIGQNNIGWLSTPWKSFASKDITPPYTGELSLDNFYSQRVILDLANQKILFGHYSDNDRLTVLLNTITGLPIGLDNSGCVIKAPDMPSQIAPSAGALVDSIAGIPGAQIAQALRNPSNQSAQLLERLHTAARPPFNWETRLPSGGEKVWTMSAQGLIQSSP